MRPSAAALRLARSSNSLGSRTVVRSTICLGIFIICQYVKCGRTRCCRLTGAPVTSARSTDRHSGNQHERAGSRYHGLGYVGMRAKDLDDWSGYGRDFLGMQQVDKSRASPSAWTTASSAWSLTPTAGEGLGFFGWEVADAAALDAWPRASKGTGTPVARGSRALADERHVKDLIVFNDPVGNRLEIFHGAETAADPFMPGRTSPDSAPARSAWAMWCSRRPHRRDDAFYRDVLGFRISDYCLAPFPAYFFHVNPRHHSLAFVEPAEHGASHDGRAVQPRRRRPGLRPRATDRRGSA